MADKQIVKARIVRFFIIISFLVVTANLFRLQILQNDYYKNKSLDNRQISKRVNAPRGRIFDRDGIVLADNQFTSDITVANKCLTIAGPDSTLTRLIDWFSLDEKKVYESLLRQQKANRPRLTVIYNASMSELITVKEKSREIPLASVQSEARRRYIFGDLFAHIVGYVGEVRQSEIDLEPENPIYLSRDNIGRYGVEATFEEELRGQPGQYLYEVDSVGRVVGHKSVEWYPVLPGQDVQLTMSVDLQRSLYELMAERQGCAVAIDVNSGDLLASVSNPGFDPNMFVSGISTLEWDRLMSNPGHPFMNRLIQGTYPPASPYKIITSLCALSGGSVTRNTVFKPCTGAFFYGDRNFRCWKRTGHGVVDHTAALVHSCDVFYYQAGLTLSLDSLHDTATIFGLGQLTGIPLNSEVAGNIPSTQWYDSHFGKNKWTRGVILNNAIGQGEILATPLQMAVMTARVASGNAVLSPRLTVSEPLPPYESLPFSSDDIKWIHTAMTKVVDIGTGTKAKLSEINVAGKTGTAQTPHGEDHAWFVCFAPAEEPEIALVVLLEHAGHGGTVCAPVAANWLTYYFDWKNDRMVAR